MSLYKILVADDQPELNRPMYKRLLDDPAHLFDWKLVETRREFEGAQFEDYDAVLLDVNLPGWDYMSLAEAVLCVGSRAPIVLASQVWYEDHTHQKISEVLALAKEAHFVQILILDDLGSDAKETKVRAIREQLRLAIARHRRHALLKLADDEPLHILHLSDPQYGDPDTDGWAAMAEEEIGKHISKIQPDVHFVAISGDITYQGGPSEVDIAYDRIDSLLHAIFPTQADRRERLLLVPGNHDVNLRLAAADVLRYDFKKGKPVVHRKDRADGNAHRRFALRPFRELAWRLTGDPNWLESSDLCWINDGFRHLGIRFFLLNSVGELDCSAPSRAHLSLDALRRLARGRARQEKIFSVAFCHHGPPGGSDGSPDQAGADEVLAVDNWPEAAKLLQIRDIRVLIHGHGHERRVDRLPWNTGECGVRGDERQGRLSNDEFLRIMAPTSHLGGKLRRDGAPRGFNLITLHRSRRQVERIEVVTYSLGSRGPSKVDQVEFQF